MARLEALIAKRFPKGKGIYKGKSLLACWTCTQIRHLAHRCLNKDNKDNDTKKMGRYKKFKDNYKVKIKKECYIDEYDGSGDDFDGNIDDEEIIFFTVKEEPSTCEEETSKAKTWIPNMNNNDDWIIENGCIHYMTRDRNKFLIMEECNGGVVRFCNGSPCVIRGKGYISLNEILLVMISIGKMV